MKFILYLAVAFFTLAIPFKGISQTLTMTTSAPVGGAVCSLAPTLYEISRPSGFGACTITWTVTNGSRTVDPFDQSKVTVTWNDTPGATGTITATFSNCGSGNEGNNSVTRSLNYLILSVKDKAWDSYGTSISLTYCSTSSVNVSVPHMYVQGTGGIAQPSLQEVVYEWTLPSGWKESSTNSTGTFYSPFNVVNIVPTACSIPGQVTVKGRLASYCNYGPPAPSATATISLSGSPAITVTPQGGFSGVMACNTTAITFYANSSVSLSCVNSYVWNFPPSWSYVSQSGNTITLSPGGSLADIGAIKSTVNLTCGSSLVSANYTPNFVVPVVAGPSMVCSDGSSYTVSNVPGGTSVVWSASSNISINASTGYAVPNGGGSGWVQANVTTCGSGSFPISKTITNVGLIATASGDSYIGVNSYGDYNASASCGPTPYSIDWFVKNETENLGAPYYIATGSDITLKSVTNPGLPNVVSRTFSLYARVIDNVGAVYFTDLVYITTKNRGNLIDATIAPRSSGENSFSVYPNPASSYFEVADVNNSDDFMIKLFNDQGKLVLEDNSQKGLLRVNTKQFLRGAYSIQILRGRTIELKHIVIE